MQPTQQDEQEGPDMTNYVLTVEREIGTTPEAIFAVLSDASQHTLIDGSGMVQGQRRAPRNG